MSATVSDRLSGIITGFFPSGTHSAVTAETIARIAASRRIPIRSFFVSRSIVRDGLAQKFVDKHGGNQQRRNVADYEQDSRHDG